MSNVQIIRLTVGQMQENCYLLKDIKTGALVIIDPGDDAQYIVDKITSVGGKPEGILATHGHFDHALAALELQLIYSIPFRMNEADQFLLDRMSETAKHFLGIEIPEKPPVITKTLTEFDVLTLGQTSVRVLYTPGHTPGSICLYLPDERTLLSGDTLFAKGSVGRTDFSYSNALHLSESVATLLKLPPETIVYPGHGEETTIGSEMEYHTYI